MVKGQSGLTLIGFLIVLSLIIFVAYLGMKIAPMYMDYYSVVGAMEGVQRQPGMARATPSDIKAALFKRLYINYVDDIGVNSVKVTRTGGGVHLRVVYETRESVLGNLDVVASFDHSVKLN